jgi:phosphoenolpyruvate carboxylase
LLVCYRSLQATGHALIADGKLTDCCDGWPPFGVTLARLDIRQDSARHTAALAAITSALGLGSYAEWDEAARLAFLSESCTAAAR